jgi:Sedlin, N-terminal conserved region
MQSKLHELFIQYTLNPFTKLRDPIVSERFDKSVADAVEIYNESAKQRRSGSEWVS